VNFCGNCGHPVTIKIPEGDDRDRHCCDSCGYIHYYNPKIIVTCIPRWEDKILLCKRGIEPRLGYWTIPGGFMEVKETTEEGAIRETWEECRARVDISRLHGIYNVPHINQVYFVYLADMTSPEFETTLESTELRLATLNDIPWDDIAFKVIGEALKQYVNDVAHGFEGIHQDTLIHPND